MGYRPLPGQEQLAHMLGITPDELEWFQAQIDSEVKIDPAVPKAGLETLAIISTVISVGLTIVASFFKPKQKERGGGGVRSQTQDAVNVTRNQRFAPRRGFDSVQQPAILGSTTPIVYANQRSLPAQTTPPRPAGRYGGVRVNMDLLWSQMLSVGGSQVLKALFMIGEGRIGGIEPYSFAIGDNTLGAYDIGTQSSVQSGGRATIYYADNGGRIRSSNYILGRSASSDIGNAENNGGADVFSIRSEGNNWRQDSCYTVKPSTQTVFGVYSIIPNNLGLRVSPRIRPTVNVATRSRNKGESYQVSVEDDGLALSELWKAKYWWSGRSGIISTSRGVPSLNEGDTFVYMLSRTSDATTRIVFNSSNTNNPDDVPDASTNCGDIASTVSGRQNSAADALTIGELYKAGSCLAVLESISPDDAVFQSEAEFNPTSNAGTTVRYTFRVVRSGTVSVTGQHQIDTSTDGLIRRPPQWGPVSTTRMANLATLGSGTSYQTATSSGQIFRCAIANVQINQRVKCFEIGFKSTLGIKASGLCNFRDALELAEVNHQAGYRLNERVFPEDVPVYVQAFQSGTISAPTERYSFHRLQIRTEGGAWDTVPCTIGFRSQTSQPIYNYLRVELPFEDTPEFRLEPLTGWEIRNEMYDTPLMVLDGTLSTTNTTIQGGYRLTWTGTTVTNTPKFFQINAWEPRTDIGLGWTENSTMLGDYAKLAEAFVYEEVQTTVGQGPEHEVVYVNVITANTVAPNYDFLGIIGGVFRAATEWAQFAQFSVRVIGGRMVRRLILSSTFGPSSLLPDIAYDLLRSTRLGVGQVMSEQQIDIASFTTTATWLEKRRYFYDGVIADKVNLRQWLADTAAMMLVDIVERDGRFAMEPAVIFPDDGTGKPVIQGLYTAGNIVPGSFSLTFIPEEDRQPIQARGKWREERPRSAFTRSGVFPVERDVLVREADRPETDPIETFDLSEFCTNFEHCVDALCYLIRLRRLLTHEIKFTTRPSSLLGGVFPGAYIRVAMDFTYYDEFANGVILNDGTVITTRPDLITIGGHRASTWDGVSPTLTDSFINVAADGKATPTGIIFVKKNSTTQVRTYKIDEVNITGSREIEVQATFHPTDQSGFSLITKNWTTYQTDANWVITPG
jgi:hypothetical protein